MNKILKFLNKYWLVFSICSTIVTSLITIGWHFKTRIDKDEDTINDTNSWVQEHDDDIQSLKDDVNRLKEDQRLREQGLCK